MWGHIVGSMSTCSEVVRCSRALAAALVLLGTAGIPVRGHAQDLASEPRDWALGSPVAGQGEKSEPWGTVAVPDSTVDGLDFPAPEDGSPIGLEHDFNGDGDPDVLASSAPICGAKGNCTYVLIDGRTDSVLGTFSGGFIVVRARRLHGWPVLETWHTMSADLGLYSIHVFDDGRYVELTRILVEGEGRERLRSRLGRVPLAPGPGTPFPTELACRDTTVTGRVKHSAEFEAEIGANLLFRLDPGSANPRNPQGWTIRVTPSDAPDADYSRVVTPPYRFSNARYVDTGYGYTAEQALAWTPRTFRFVVDEHAYERATETLRILLWSGEHSDEEINRARAARDSLRSYEGTFTIVDGAVRDEDGQGSLGVIDWMSFRAEVCVPAL